MITEEPIYNNYFSPAALGWEHPEFTPTRSGSGLRPHVESVTVTVGISLHPHRQPHEIDDDMPNFRWCEVCGKVDHPHVHPDAA